MARRLKAGERRASILAVAKVLFADRGYHGVSVDEIAGRLGVSPAVLYRHFDSKEALYEAALTEISG
ncbi:MAG TPA: helix-turn-helix domain-containing protein, partial [Gammaproteobacteria bacterium]|nr:helix-turn-helix domain-containing protein [Gammaproteobacteria bacterium]